MLNKDFHRDRTFTNSYVESTATSHPWLLCSRQSVTSGLRRAYNMFSNSSLQALHHRGGQLHSVSWGRRHRDDSGMLPYVSKSPFPSIRWTVNLGCDVSSNALVVVAHRIVELCSLPPWFMLCSDHSPLQCFRNMCALRKRRGGEFVEQEENGCSQKGTRPTLNTKAPCAVPGWV